MAGTHRDPRVRLVVHECDGPTTKADCLNRLYAAMEADERRSGTRYRMILQHDAEDMVDPAALGLLDAALERADFVQLPVLPTPQPASRWIGSHYCEEFAEAHAKAMVVRGALGVALPAAGVGCAFSRELLGTIAAEMNGAGPFSVDSLTEDYELGLKIKAAGGTAWFLRARGEDGRLVATRACFPATLPQAVRQKARWIHGIALQGWDRLGWSGGIGERWMRLRDRRGPLAALLLLAAYAAAFLWSQLFLAEALGAPIHAEFDPALTTLLTVNGVLLAWRILMRAGFTTYAYGPREGGLSIPRLVVGNIIAILAAARAIRIHLAGGATRWDKTRHIFPAELPR